MLKRFEPNQLPSSSPPSPPSSPSPPPPDLQSLLTHQLPRIPLIDKAERFWRDLKKLEGWWLILLPFLAWVGWSTYRQERAKVLRERFARQQQSSKQS